jgi:hypothetical protein
MKWKRQDEFGALQSAKAASELSVPPSEANEVNEALGGSSGTGNPPELDALVREDECEKYMKSMRRENTNYYKIAF